MKCLTCGKSNFKRLKDYRYHVNNCGEFTCTICAMVLCSKTEMKRHMEVHLETHKCAVCSKLFKTKQGLDRHNLVHNKDVQYICPHCTATFTQKFNLKRHINKQHN